MTKPPADPPADDWGSWESARRRQLTKGMDVPAADLLDWLEEAIRFAHEAGALPRRRE